MCEKTTTGVKIIIIHCIIFSEKLSLPILDTRLKFWSQCLKDEIVFNIFIYKNITVSVRRKFIADNEVDYILKIVKRRDDTSVGQLSVGNVTIKDIDWIKILILLNKVFTKPIIVDCHWK